MTQYDSYRARIDAEPRSICEHHGLPENIDIAGYGEMCIACLHGLQEEVYGVEV